MSYKVKFFIFSKRLNSTKIPSTAGTEYNCIIKSESGLSNPTVELVLAPTWSPSYNYCNIPAFGRWYWVREWTYSERKWIATLECDPLASFKTYIGNSQPYVLRSSYEKDTRILDTNYPITTEVQRSSETTVGDWFSNFYDMSSGAFIVGLRGRVNAAQTAGGITYLAMTLAQFKSFTDELFSSSLNNYLAGGAQLDISDTLAQMIFNPAQYVSSCMWLPSMPSSQSNATSFTVGWWSFSLSGVKIMSAASGLAYQQDFLIPSTHEHPQVSRGQYLNAPPFTQRILALPRYGIVDISGAVPANVNKIRVDLTIDPISGQGIYTLSYNVIGDTYLQVFDQIQCQIGVSLPLSSNEVTIQEALSSVAGVAAGTQAALSGNFAGAVANIGSSFTVLQPHINDISAASGFLGYQEIKSPKLINFYKLVADADPTEDGQPLCKIRQISNIPGYIKCLHGDEPIYGATAGEMEKIKEYLEGGFFYE